MDAAAEPAVQAEQPIAPKIHVLRVKRKRSDPAEDVVSECLYTSTDPMRLHGLSAISASHSNVSKCLFAPQLWRPLSRSRRPQRSSWISSRQASVSTPRREKARRRSLQQPQHCPEAASRSQRATRGRHKVSEHNDLSIRGVCRRSCSLFLNRLQLAACTARGTGHVCDALVV